MAVYNTKAHEIKSWFLRIQRADPWFFAGACVVFTLSVFLVAAFYVNHPTPEIDNDTIGYMTVVTNITAHGWLVDPLHVPGYPLFVALIFALMGQGNLMAVSVATGGLFVLATLEVYLIVYLITQRAWIGALISLAMVSNFWLLTWIKPIIVEGFTLWVTVTLALVTLVFLRTPTVARLWVVAAVTLALFMTRPEWIYLPIPLFAYLLLIAWRHGHFRQLLPHALLAVVALYLVLGAYVAVNATQNNFPGVSESQNINLFGKIIQYR